MTASRARRTRATWIALSVTLVALIVAGVLAVAGVRTLRDSRAGREVVNELAGLPVQRLPFTPTALVGSVDDAGRLTTVVVMAVEPDGTGGSIVEIAASADTNSGNEDSLEPLGGVLATQGAEGFAAAAETLAGIAFDVVELVDPQRFTQLMTPLGDIQVELPTVLYDDSGEQWPAGSQRLTGSQAARALTASNPAVADHLFEPARAAVWQGVAARVGAGIGSAEPVADDQDLPRPATLDEFTARLFADEVRFRQLGIRPVDAERVTAQLSPEMAGAAGAAASVVVHDRAEMLMVMGAVAPGRVGAPLAAPTFRVTSGFDDAELAALGYRNSDVLNQAIDRLLFAQVNVVSVAALPAAQLPGGAVPERSTFVVADPDVIDGVREQYEGIFGSDIEVRAADVLIDGVNIELILGRDFLTTVQARGGANVESSGADAAAPATSAAESG
jgi:hypothetical protein